MTSPWHRRRDELGYLSNRQTQIQGKLCMMSIVCLVSIILSHEMLRIQMPKYLPGLCQAVQQFPSPSHP